jgi:hypothetical protein
MAYDGYTRARASPDQLKKQKLTKLADDYVKQAEQLRRGQIMQAGFPESDRAIG